MRSIQLQGDYMCVCLCTYIWYGKCAQFMVACMCVAALDKAPSSQ